MPSFRELNKRLKSAETIVQLSGAMRSAATANYLKISGTLSAYLPYAEALADVRSAVHGESAPPSPCDCGAEGKRLFILLSGRHGLCGGYHQALFTFFSERLKSSGASPVIITCGKKANEYCREKKLCVLEDHPVSEIPLFSQAKALADRVIELFGSGEIAGAEVVYQCFENMLRQTPAAEPLPVFSRTETAKEGCGRPSDPGSAQRREDAQDDVLFFPDRAAAEDGLDRLMLASELYSKFLSAAAGVQAATMIAMRSASDNAQEAVEKLETDINRLRQADITASVLETSAAPMRPKE